MTVYAYALKKLVKEIAKTTEEVYKRDNLKVLQFQEMLTYRDMGKNLSFGISSEISSKLSSYSEK